VRLRGRARVWYVSPLLPTTLRLLCGRTWGWEAGLTQTCMAPTFQIVFLFHADLALFERTLPRCLDALAAGTAETYEVVLQCDGTPPEIARGLVDCLAGWGGSMSGESGAGIVSWRVEMPRITVIGGSSTSRIGT